MRAAEHAAELEKRRLQKQAKDDEEERTNASENSFAAGIGFGTLAEEHHLEIPDFVLPDLTDIAEQHHLEIPDFVLPDLTDTTKTHDEPERATEEQDQKRKVQKQARDDEQERTEAPNLNFAAAIGCEALAEELHSVEIPDFVLPILPINPVGASEATDEGASESESPELTFSIKPKHSASKKPQSEASEAPAPGQGPKEVRGFQMPPPETDSEGASAAEELSESEQEEHIEDVAYVAALPPAMRTWMTEIKRIEMGTGINL